MKTLERKISASRCKPRLAIGTILGLAALGVAGCSDGMEHIARSSGFANIDASALHPILVSQQPAHLSVAVGGGADGLSPHQRANIADFMGRYRGADAATGKITISVPSGSSNEVAAHRAVADVREIIGSFGVDDNRVAVRPYRADHGRQAPLRLSYERFVAEAPECGSWPTNLSDNTRNLPSPNFGCATQRNFAQQVAYPADLLEPRTLTPAVSEARDAKWEKFLRGESVISKKDADEKASIKSQQ